MPLILVLWRQRWLDLWEFQASLVYIIDSRTRRTIQRTLILKNHKKSLTDFYLLCALHACARVCAYVHTSRYVYREQVKAPSVLLNLSLPHFLRQGLLLKLGLIWLPAGSKKPQCCGYRCVLSHLASYMGTEDSNWSPHACGALVLTHCAISLSSNLCLFVNLKSLLLSWLQTDGISVPEWEGSLPFLRIWLFPIHSFTYM